MRNNRAAKKPFAVFILALLLAFSTSGFILFDDTFFEVARGIELFTKVYKEITFNYVDEISPAEFLIAGIRGMLATLDPYTIYMDEKKQEDIDLLTTGKYGGIGVMIGLRESKITILEILDGYSAQKQGLQVGDIILNVDGQTVNEKNFDRISSLVKGEAGSFVRLLINRGAVTDTLRFELLREEIKVKNVAFADFIDSSRGIIYLKLSQFSRTAGDEVKNALLELKKKAQVTGIIFDLRNNPGGLLDISVDIANRFLEKGQLIVSTKGRDSSTLRQYFANQAPIFKSEPVVFLINEGSASASEILAGAIQDHDRGVILGTKSFGKGLVQTISPLAYNTSLKITTSKYFTPSGRCIQRINYSHDNKVITHYDSTLSTLFSTDKKRKVFSSGGITPDSLVEPEQSPPIVRYLLAQGVFFRFANEVYSKNQTKKLSELSDDFLLKALRQFLNSEKFVYHSELEKKIEELQTLASKDKQYAYLKKQINTLREDSRSSSSFDVEDYRQEILEEAKIELAARFTGSDGRIRETLKYDLQFQCAYRLLKQDEVYNKILSGK